MPARPRPPCSAAQAFPLILIDPHPVYPPDFRVEKLSGDEQVERFRKTGIADAALRAATHDGENWIARFGYLLDKRPSQQYGILYDALVNAIRARDFRRHRIDLQQGDIDFDQARSGKNWCCRTARKFPRAWWCSPTD